MQKPPEMHGTTRDLQRLLGWARRYSTRERVERSPLPGGLGVDMSGLFEKLSKAPPKPKRAPAPDEDYTVPSNEVT
jgi:hypothetical protein